MFKVKAVLTGLLLLCSVGIANATVLTFDDLNGTNLPPIPNGYGGLNWDNMHVTDINNYSSNNGYVNGLVSGDNVAFNAGGMTAAVSDSSFTFNGAYLTGAWNDGLNITVEGYLGAALLYTQTVVVDTTAPTWFDFNYAGIDKLVFFSFGGVDHGYGGFGEHFAMDNFTFNQAVPEPSTLLLLGSGLAGLGFYRRRIKKAKAA